MKKRGSNHNANGGMMVASQGGIAVVSGTNYTENLNLQNLRGLTTGQSMNNDSSQDSLPVQSPNLLRKKFVAK